MHKSVLMGEWWSSALCKHFYAAVSHHISMCEPTLMGWWEIQLGTKLGYFIPVTSICYFLFLSWFILPLLYSCRCVINDSNRLPTLVTHQHISSVFLILLTPNSFLCDGQYLLFFFLLRIFQTYNSSSKLFWESIFVPVKLGCPPFCYLTTEMFFSYAKRALLCHCSAFY